MEQKRNRPVRINIQNKELWEKEEKLVKRWEVISTIMCILGILCIIGIWPLNVYRALLPVWIGTAYAIFYVVFICFGSLFSLVKYKTHKINFYEYKYDKKKANK